VASYLHRDHLASVRLIANAAGQAEQSTAYTPFGDPDTTTLQAQSVPEERSFIGERYDASTGLLFLNARYYDPDLGRFLQPDWWEVRQQGVGTNRYSYANNNPVNLSDPSGNCWWCIEERTVDDNGDVTVESSKFFRLVVPGQVAWDNARTKYANGDTRGAIFDTGLMLVEQGLTVVTLGMGRVAGQGSKQAITAVEIRAVTAETVASINQAARVPSVVDGTLSSIVDDIYKGVNNINRVGDGTTMAATRFEQATGQAVNGRFHMDKLVETTRRLNRFLNNPPAGTLRSDISEAENLLAEILEITSNR